MPLPKPQCVGQDRGNDAKPSAESEPRQLQSNGAKNKLALFGGGRAAAPWLLSATALGLSSGCSHMEVQPGQVAVVVKPNGPTQRVYPEGEYRLGMYDRPVFYDARSQEREEAVSVLAKNGVAVGMELSIRYHILVPETVQLETEVGTNYYSILVGPTVKAQVRRAAAELLPEEILSTERERLGRHIREGASQALLGRHVEIESVLVHNVSLPVAVQNSLDARIAAEQDAVRRRKLRDTLQRQLDEAQQEQRALEAHDRAGDSTPRSDETSEGMQRQIDALKRQVEQLRAQQRQLEERQDGDPSASP